MFSINKIKQAITGTSNTSATTKAHPASNGSFAMENGFADYIRESTAEAIRSKAQASPDGFDAVSFWANEHPDMLADMFAKLDEVMAIAAENGNHSLRVTFTNFFTPGSPYNGIEVGNTKADEGFCLVELWNFRDGFSTEACDSKEHGKLAFRAFMDIVAERFSENGFETDVQWRQDGSGKLFYPTNALTISWLADGEAEQMSKAFETNGGYAAYKAGVPLEDILASNAE